MTSIREAFAPHLGELDLCECTTCRTVVYAMRAASLGGHTENAARWAAISDQLQAVTNGTHQRVTLGEHIKASMRQGAAGPAAVRVRMSDFYTTGLGIGIGNS